MSDRNSFHIGNTESSLGTPAYVVALDRAVVLRLAAYGVLLLFLTAGVLSALTGNEGSFGTSGSVVTPALYIAVALGTIAAHELIHGLFFRVFGGSPQYGAGMKYLMPYFYATSPGRAFSVRQMIIIGLAPLVLLSMLALIIALVAPALVAYCAVVFMVNTPGAVADIWMATCLTRFLRFKDVKVVDTADSLAVYTSDVEAGRIAERLSARDQRPSGFVVQWIGASFAITAAAILATFIGPLFTDSLLIGPKEFPLVQFKVSEQGSEFHLGLAVPLLAGFLFALAARVFTWWGLRGGEAEAL
ncbi:MAG: DUF3267 domain-containing protein [Candidatus Aquicultor sp.]|nr:DUF3267 domain-containing protein [Candidatus Aquicultor sp.]